MRSSYIVFCLAVLMGCADSSSKIRYGETTKAALIAEKGQPTATEKPGGLVAGEILIYGEEQKYQVSRDVVVAGFRNPTSEERSLLYWRHQLKDCATTFLDVAAADSHLRPEKELKCAALGLSVIYDPNIDQVTRVVEHVAQ